MAGSIRLTAMILLLFWARASAGALPATRPSTQPAPDWFEPGKAWRIHIQLTADAWKQMQPGQRNRFIPRNTTGPAAADQPVISPWGYIYHYANARVDVDGAGTIDAAIRFKGNYSYSLSANGPRRPMKIEFDRAQAGRTFLGATSVNFNVSAADPSLIREPLGYEIFRAAQVPAPRTALGHVSLTVPGVYAKQDLGTYIIVEQIDERFLARHFGAAGGMLLKPEMLRGVPYMGKWEKHADRYGAAEGTTAKSGERFVEFLRLIHFADDATFASTIGQFIDEDEFLRFLAVQALIVNTDSLLTTGHNYYLYENPKDGRYCFIPWDLNLAFGNFGIVAAAPQQLDLSVRRPFIPPNRFIERILAVPELSSRYEAILKELMAQVFTQQRLLPSIDRMQKVTGASPGARELATWVTGRIDMVNQQLAGKREGFIPGQSPGLLLANAWDEHRRSALVQSAHAAISAKLLAGKKIGIFEIKQKIDASIEGRTFNRRELADALEGVLPVPDHYVFDPGTGIQWADLIIRAADADKDGKVTSQELAAVAGLALQRADGNKDGAIDAAEIADGLKNWAAAEW